MASAECAKSYHQNQQVRKICDKVSAWMTGNFCDINKFNSFFVLKNVSNVALTRLNTYMFVVRCYENLFERHAATKVRKFSAEIIYDVLHFFQADLR